MGYDASSIARPAIPSNDSTSPQVCGGALRDGAFSRARRPRCCAPAARSQLRTSSVGLATHATERSSEPIGGHWGSGGRNFVRSWDHGTMSPLSLPNHITLGTAGSHRPQSEHRLGRKNAPVRTRTHEHPFFPNPVSSVSQYHARQLA
jgi:hypothetical protein